MGYRWRASYVRLERSRPAGRGVVAPALMLVASPDDVAAAGRNTVQYEYEYCRTSPALSHYEYCVVLARADLGYRARY